MVPDDFIQQGPELKNQYEDDDLLRSYLRRKLPPRFLQEIEPDLRRFGERVITDILEWGLDAEKHEPRHIPLDAWGNRIDKIEVTEGWKQLKRVSAEEGLIAIGYERKHGPFSRIYQFSKIYMFTPSSAIYTCPLAMTDGAARLIEVYGDEELKQNAYRHLISRKPNEFWTSGQWMTERRGGSDVGLADTIAEIEGNDRFSLHGLKWFTSAVTSEMAMTLARIQDEDGSVAKGSRGLSLFYVETKDDKGNWQNITVERLKNKLGTKALPTAELRLTGTPAKLVGDPGNGVKKIATLFNITRIYNSVSSVAYMRRMLTLAKDYAKKRFAFGKMLSEQPLHLETLASMEVEVHGAFHLAFRVVELLGKEECNEATDEEKAQLRILTPIAKLYTAKQAMETVSELLEAIGGIAYIEDSDLPRYLRDVQVLTIWEGTTNVLCLDVLRAIRKENAFEPLIKDVKRRLDAITNSRLAKDAEKVKEAVAAIVEFFTQALTKDLDYIEAAARGFAYSLARVVIASLLLEHAQWTLDNDESEKYVIIAHRWCQKDLTPLIYPDETHRKESKLILYGDD